jgi:hypothetical protein
VGIIVGTDEAGYGPNFGPLVVSASVWRVPDGLRGEALYTHLAGCIASAARAADHRVAIADSKCLYQPGNGLRNLERGVLAALGLLGDCPTCWTRIWHTLAPRHSAGCQADHAYAGFDLPLPTDLSCDELQAASCWTTTRRAACFRGLPWS